MAKKKIDPLNKKAYGAVSAALTVADIPSAVSFYQKAFGFSKRGIMNGPDGKPMQLVGRNPQSGTLGERNEERDGRDDETEADCHSCG
jgi:predicted enzyme related to lactoylglutathione lyase